MNLTKTASVKSVTTDTKILDAKRVETAELLVDGVSISEVVPKWKPREHIYRCVLEEDDDYIIYDDEGNFLDCKLDTLENGTGLFQGTRGVEEFSFSLPNLTNGRSMFNNYTSLKSFKSDLPNLRSGLEMFSGAVNLESFEGDLSSLINGEIMFNATKLTKFSAKMKKDDAEYSPLTNGNRMFDSCTLNEDSIKCILPHLQPYEDGLEHILSLPIDVSAVPYFNEITGNEQSLPAGTIVEVPYRGWNIKVKAKNLPTGYRAVAYLESSTPNGGEYIKTGVKLAWNSDTELKCYLNSNYPSQGIYGYDENNTRNILYYSLYGNTLRVDYGVDMTDSPSHLSSGIYQINRYSNKTYLNDELILTHPLYGDFEAGGEAYLFWTGYQNYFAKGLRVYSFKISRDGVLQRHFVPCIDNLGNPCMYDTITKETFRNEGSGTFLTPESATTYSLRQPVPTYARMTAHGVQKLYYTPEGYEGSEDEYAHENGFKLLMENERPDEGSWRPEWVETDNELILNWIEVEEEEMTNV